MDSGSLGCWVFSVPYILDPGTGLDDGHSQGMMVIEMTMVMLMMMVMVMVIATAMVMVVVDD